MTRQSMEGATKRNLKRTGGEGGTQTLRSSGGAKATTTATTMDMTMATTMTVAMTMARATATTAATSTVMTMVSTTAMTMATAAAERRKRTTKEGALVTSMANQRMSLALLLMTPSSGGWLSPMPRPT